MRQRAYYLVLTLMWLTVLFMALAGPLLSDFFGLCDPTKTMARAFDPPTAQHWLGTDHLGRDVLSRMFLGNAALVVPPALAAFCATSLGLILAFISALSHKAEKILRFCSDVLLAIPAMLLLLIVITATSSFLAVTLAALCLSVPLSTRYFFSTMRPMLDAGYVEVARATGTRWSRIFVQEILPGMRSAIVADISIRFVTVVFLSATAHFLTEASSAVENTWAGMVGVELRGIDLNPLAVIAPTTAIILLTACPALLLQSYTRRR